MCHFVCIEARGEMQLESATPGHMKHYPEKINSDGRAIKLSFDCVMAGAERSTWCRLVLLRSLLALTKHQKEFSLSCG